MKLYLAHPFDARHKMREWQIHMKKSSSVELVNPFFDVERPDKTLIESAKAKLQSQDTREKRYSITDEQASELVNRDISLIEECDGIIAIVDGSLSYGTIQEMVYAKTMGKKVYSMVSNGQFKHPWLRHHSTRVFENMVELSDFLMWLGEGIEKESKGE